MKSLTSRYLAVCVVILVGLLQFGSSPSFAASVERVLRLEHSAQVQDYSEQITQKLRSLADAGGGTLVIPYGKYPVLNHVVLELGDKQVTLKVQGEKDEQGRLPVLFDTDVARDPHHFFFMKDDMQSPRVSLWFSNIEMQGNNVPRDASKATRPFILDEGQTDLEPNVNLPRDQSYGHPFFFRGNIHSAAIRAMNVKELHVDHVVIRDFFGNGIVVANYGAEHWQRERRSAKVNITNSQIYNVWEWHQYDNTGDGIMMWNVGSGKIENNRIINDLAHTRWFGRCGIVLETNTEGILVKNNVISGYARNIHIELTFGGHQIINNKLLASDNGITLNEPNLVDRNPEVLKTTRPVLIKDNVFEYAQERERYGIHQLGGPRAFIGITFPRSPALNGSQLINNRFTYKLHKDVKLNPWRAYDVQNKTRHIYVQNAFLIENWVEKGNRFQ